MVRSADKSGSRSPQTGWCSSCIACATSSADPSSTRSEPACKAGWPTARCEASPPRCSGGSRPPRDGRLRQHHARPTTCRAVGKPLPPRRVLDVDRPQPLVKRVAQRDWGFRRTLLVDLGLQLRERLLCPLLRCLVGTSDCLAQVAVSARHRILSRVGAHLQGPAALANALAPPSPFRLFALVMKAAYAARSWTRAAQEHCGELLMLVSAWGGWDSNPRPHGS